MAHIGRSVKNVEAPRPLKSQSRSSLKNNFMVIEELIQLIESVAMSLQAGNNQTEPMAALMLNLRIHGPQLESVSKDILDRAFVVFRNASQDERLNIMTRLNLLELIELRAKGWEDNGINAYYKTKQASNAELPEMQQHQHHHLMDISQAGYLSTSPTFGGSAAAAAAIAAVGSAQQQQLFLGIGEVICNSGKFPKPTKIPGKTYCKDEVVIRNGDSGKVMGIKGRRVHMIEELSETVISFQRVNPGAKERLVQITGPTEEKINYAKKLIEDTIRRNASPVRLEPSLISGNHSGGAGAGVGGSCSSLASSNSDEVQPRTPGGGSSALANRLSFNSAQNFMTASAAASAVQNQYQQQQQQQQEVLNMINAASMTAAPIAATSAAAAGKILRQPSQLLLHSFSTNDASLGEYKYTVNVGQHMIKITGDCCELVRIAKLVLDDYFSSAEFLGSVDAGAAHDGSSLLTPISTPSTPMGAPKFAMGTPLHTPTTSVQPPPLVDSGIGLNYLSSATGGINNTHEGDDEVFSNDANNIGGSQLSRSRRSHFSRKDTTPESANPSGDAVLLKSESIIESSSNKIAANSTATQSIDAVSRISYDFEKLLNCAQNSYAWELPHNWRNICEKFPAIVCNKDVNDESNRFNGQKYLELIKSGTKRSPTTTDD